MLVIQCSPLRRHMLPCTHCGTWSCHSRGCLAASEVMVCHLTMCFCLQIWVKPPQYLARDRLLGTYTVRPALARLRTTLLGLAGTVHAGLHENGVFDIAYRSH